MALVLGRWHGAGPVELTELLKFWAYVFGTPTLLY